MEDDAVYVPFFARVKFKLQACKEAEASPEFVTLATQTAEIITTFQLQLKKQIIKKHWVSAASHDCSTQQLIC
jgi:hypothetical protein